MIAPHISTGAYGETVLEWDGPNGRRLSIYIEEDKVTYLKSWGPDMELQMKEGDLPELHNLLGWVGSSTNG